MKLISVRPIYNLHTLRICRQTTTQLSPENNVETGILCPNKIRSTGLKVISMDSLYCLGNSLLHCYNTLQTLQQYSENNKNIITHSWGIFKQIYCYRNRRHILHYNYTGTGDNLIQRIIVGSIFVYFGGCGAWLTVPNMVSCLLSDMTGIRCVPRATLLSTGLRNVNPTVYQGLPALSQLRIYQIKTLC